MTHYSPASTAIADIDDEFAWRHKELRDLECVIKTGVPAVAERVLVRAAVPFLYSHWEGFVKRATEILIDYVAETRRDYVALHKVFWLFSVRGILKELGESENPTTSAAALDKVMNLSSQRARFTSHDAVMTESNLTFRVFSRIARSVGIDVVKYESYKHLIDTALVHARNNIAHGNALSVSSERYFELQEEVIGVMRHYSNDLQNTVALRTYLALPPSQPGP